jgi:CheY-like chemotaxis protein
MANVVALVADLMFGSRIREAAAPAGTPVRTARKLEACLEACRSEPPTIVLVDLDDERLQPLDAVRALRAEPALAVLPIVGFVSHVDAARAQQALAAGCTRVLARSAFVVELPSLVR